MECSCEINIDSSEGVADFMIIKMVIARKIHKCCECGESINIKDEYEYLKGNWDGQYSTFKTCLPCLSVRNTMFKDGYCFGMIWNDVIENIFENGGMPENCISRLHPIARGKICDIIESEWMESDDEDG